MSGVRNVHKIIRRVKLDVLINDVAQPILMLHILHPSLLIPLSLPYTFLSLASPLYLTSPFPVTNIASFRTIERVQKDVPTTAASNSLLYQAVIAYLEG